MTITTDQGNKNTKWIWIGLGGAVLFCLCAVAVAFFVFYRVGKTVEEGMNIDPESAARAAHEIADYDLPPGYQEQAAMDIMFYSFVIIAPEGYTTSKPIIMLAQFNSTSDPEEMKEQMRRSFEQQYGGNGTNMQLKEVKKMTIRGEETDVAIYEGEDETGTFMRQLITVFPGKDGTALLMIMGNVRSWDEDVIDDFIESIR